jgi:hypothetical protein
MWKADLMNFYMAIAQKAAGLVLLLLKLLAIHIRGSSLVEPMLKRMQMLVGRLCQEPLSEVRRLIFETTEDEDILICFQIIFQLFFLGYGICNVICEPNTEWNPIIVALMYVIWIGVLIWEGFKLYIAGKKLGPQPTNNNNEMIV